MSLKVKASDIKTLNAFINESNEFKRFILCQLWITQQFTNTLTTNDILTRNINQSEPNIITDATIYNIFRDIKSKLTEENDKLAQVVVSLKNNFAVLHVMNEIFELGLNTEDEMKDKIKQIEQTIKTNQDYINKINNLSEAQIANIRNVSLDS